MKYIGPKGERGIISKGTSQKPWEWKADEIEPNLEKWPQFEKYFKTEKPAKKPTT